MPIRPHELAALLACAAASPLLAQVESAKLTAGMEPDGLRGGVALTEGRAFVGFGEHWGPLGFVGGGGVFVFEPDGSGGWHEVAFLATHGLGLFDYFGYSVSAEADRALVGAWGVEGLLGVSGEAYVFERNASGTWSQAAKLAADGGQVFGKSVSLSGDRALIGAPYNDDWVTNGGAAYVFERNAAGEWLQVTILTPSDAGQADLFGESVALCGDRALVGAPSVDGFGADAGSAYVFERSPGGAWVQVQKLTGGSGPGGGTWDNSGFGGNVSLSGDRALVTAFGDDTLFPDAGAAFVFERDGSGTWIQTAELFASDAAPHAWFGSSGAISGDRVLLGRNGEQSSVPGAVHSFERSAVGVWSEVEILTPSVVVPSANFGTGVSLLGDRALIGAPLDSPNGAAYVFDFPLLTGSPAEISVAAGGSQVLAIDGDPSEAGLLYLVLGTASGTAPGLPSGSITVPLNLDSYLLFTLTQPNNAVLSKSLGFLDSWGNAAAKFSLPPAFDPSLVGVVLHHAVLGVDALGGPSLEFASDPVPVQLVP